LPEVQGTGETIPLWTVDRCFGWGVPSNHIKNQTATIKKIFGKYFYTRFVSQGQKQNPID
jgi:hypothetical protein